MKKLYETKVTATGGRNGRVESEDGIIQLDLRMPKGLGGDGGAYSNPEQLFAAGYSACFDGALNLVASQRKHSIKSKITATVGLNSADDGFHLSVNLAAEIEGVDRDTANELLHLAHQVCPYSRATRNNIEVTLNLI
ncbi:MAG TPA: organic hydroperoxide resistance protein [Candidatus Kapabacteria bacterium]|nr:organic hydroperoxide resistance protein [Candidatus Kapabacteria bacterium]HPO63124.1 organic hydroperoxide resistance protein [Candidatus Kapabacteria bacterium]